LGKGVPPLVLVEAVSAVKSLEDKSLSFSRILQADCLLTWIKGGNSKTDTLSSSARRIE
jgi:hypothetical protein